MATANFSPTKRVWLEWSGYTAIQHSNGTGRTGEFLRPASGVGNAQETILLFDVTSIAGATVTNCSLQWTALTQGVNIASTSYLFDQDKTAPTGWTTPDPKFSDFAITTWATQLQTITVNSIGTYTFPTSPSFVSTVQNWVDNSLNNWGLIIGTNFFAVGSYLSVDSATLTVTYTPGLQKINQSIFRGIERGIGNGVR